MKGVKWAGHVTRMEDETCAQNFGSKTWRAVTTPETWT